MLQRLYKITFKDYNQIDLDLFSEITDFLSGRQDGSYGEILYPTKDHFTKKKVFGLTNKLLVGLYADDDSSASGLSSDFASFLIESERNFLTEFCLMPLVHISFNGQNHVDESLTEGILKKYEGVILQPGSRSDSLSFRVKCQINDFDVLPNIADEFKSASYEFEVEYYF